MYLPTSMMRLWACVHVERVPLYLIIRFIYFFVALIQHAPEARERHCHMGASTAEASASRLLIEYSPNILRFCNERVWPKVWGRRTDQQTKKSGLHYMVARRLVMETYRRILAQKVWLTITSIYIFCCPSFTFTA